MTDGGEGEGAFQRLLLKLAEAADALEDAKNLAREGREESIGLDTNTLQALVKTLEAGGAYMEAHLSFQVMAGAHALRKENPDITMREFEAKMHEMFGRKKKEKRKGFNDSWDAFMKFTK